MIVIGYIIGHLKLPYKNSISQTSQTLYFEPQTNWTLDSCSKAKHQTLTLDSSSMDSSSETKVWISQTPIIDGTSNFEIGY